MLDSFNNSSLDGDQSSIQPDIRPIKSVRPKLSTSRERKQVAFVPTMKILKEEFPRDEEESSVGAFSHKATRKVIEPSPLPHSIFFRMKYKYGLSKSSSKAGTTLPQHTEDSSNLDLCNAESWRSFDNRFTEEFFNHRGPVTSKAIRRKPAVSNFSMISTSAVWGSERSTSPAADLDRSYGKQPLLRDMLGPEWYELLRDSAVEPEQLCEDLIEYFPGLGISGRLVYCFGFCANESAIRLEPLRDGYGISKGSYSIAPDIRTITLFTRPAQMLLLDSDDPASSPIKPLPCIELTDGLTKSIHRLQHEQDDRGTTQGTIQASSHHTSG